MKLFAIMMAFGLAMAAMPAMAGDLKVGDDAPNFTLKGTDGKTAPGKI